MSKVYFAAIPGNGISNGGQGGPVSGETAESASLAGRRVLEALAGSGEVQLTGKIPLKVHFGETGNKTFLGPEIYAGVRDFLAERSIESSYIETNVLYAGHRCNREVHLKTAANHGFTQLPVIIADGDQGEEFIEVPVKGRHFTSCRIGRAFADFDQVLVVSHFKGHRMAGFGGAIKQLAMGFASRAGKMDQHANAVPFVIPIKCSRCGACVKYCPEKAISMGFIRARINAGACVGCAGCIARCPKKAIIPNFLKSFSGNFVERVVEYAAAAHFMNASSCSSGDSSFSDSSCSDSSCRGMGNIYVSFAMNITKGCDCEGVAMKPISPDIGVFASLDPVAIDQACLDMVARVNNGRKLLSKGDATLGYAEKMGMGSREYELIQI